MSSSPRRAVLVADGDPAICSLLSAIVTHMELEPVAVRDGRAAARLLAQRKFDAVVLDLLLPLRRGEEIVAELAARDPETARKTIVITTLPPQWVAERCTGAAAILRKPFALDEIQEAIRHCCAR